MSAGYGSPDTDNGGNSDSSGEQGGMGKEADAAQHGQQAAEGAPMPEREDAQALTLVGLGGSAGSIPALEAFLQSIPIDGPMDGEYNGGDPYHHSAYVVVLHLSPEHESWLAELLGRTSRLPVQQVTETVRVEPGRVYVIPPGRLLELSDGHLRLRTMEPGWRDGTRTAIDNFFRTLAAAYGPQSAAVVLSGTGADGTLGLKRVKEVGGLAVAQTPAEAEHDAMPKSAIATGLVDYVLPAAAMPAQIVAYWETSRRMRLPEEAAPSPEQREEGREQEAALAGVLSQVRAQTGHDFSLYKRATVLRRVGRRMQVNGMETLPAYLDFLSSHPAEVGDLVSDLLINVTQFFRDPEAWEALGRDVIPRLFQDRGQDRRQDRGEGEVRAWVCGCATGEEAYTLAMLLLEQAARLPQSPPVQVFATDMDPDAIARARAGVYPDTIAADVPEERLRRWFFRNNSSNNGGMPSGSYQVRQELREVVLFATHDVLRDTPFSRLDLVTCRNVLIYLNREAQERAFKTFHFALKPDGRLMLGPSESAEGGNGLFALTNKQHRLYARRPVARGGGAAALPPLFPLAVGVAGAAALSSGHSAGVPQPRQAAFVQPAFTLPQPARPVSGGRELLLSLMERYGPPTALVDESHDVIHLSNGAGRFLRLTDGEPTRNLLQLAEPDLRVELRAALFAAAGEGVDQVRVVGRDVRVEGDQGGAQGAAAGSAPANRTAPPVRLTVRPVVDVPEGAARGGYFLVQFEELQEILELQSSPTGAPVASPWNSELVRRLEEENATLHRQLRSTVEQYEALTEELKASNEELQAMNEEQRSAAEELETSREELQSVNEELSTVNHELKHRVEEVSAANSDLSNFLSATDIATVFLDRELRVRRYTPAAEALFNLIPTDVGRPLAHVTHRLEYPELLNDAESVLARLAPVEREVATRDASDGSGGDGSPQQRRHFLAWLLPYRSLDDRIDGVVLNFLDVTQRKRAEEVLRQSAEELRASEERQAFLLRLSDALRAEPDANAMADRALQMLSEHLRLDRCFVGVYRLAENRGAFPHQIGNERVPPLPDGGVGPSDFPDALRVAFDRTLVIDDIAEAEGLTDADRRNLGALGLRALVVAPVRGGDSNSLWAIDAVSADPRHWTPGEVALLEEAAERTWAAMERARTEAAVREREEQFRRAVEEAPIPVIMHAEDGEVLQISRSWTELTGYTLEDREVLHTWLTQAYGVGGEGVRDAVEHSFAFLPQAGNPMRAIVFDISTRQGERRTWSFSASTPGALRDGRRFVVGMAEDITERRQVEDALRASLDALRESEARFRTLADAVPQVIWTNAATGEATYFNQRWYEYTGLTYEQSAGPGWQAIVHPEDAPASVERWQRALAEGALFDAEYRLRAADGSYRWFIGRNVPIRDAQGTITGWFGSATDIQELTELRERLEARVTERTSELATLLSERQQLVARLVTAQEDERRRISRELHDEMGQLLTGFSLGLRNLESAFEVSDPAAAALPRLAGLRNLTEQMSREVHRLAVELRPTALDDIGLAPAVESYVAAWSQRTGVAAEFAEIGLDGERFPPLVETTVYRVVQEALTNAAKYAVGMPGGATLVSVTLQRRANVIQATIEDDGPGFDLDEAASGAGGGLGLAGMRERAELAGGTLGIESEPGQGTTAFLRIPIEPFQPTLPIKPTPTPE